MSKFIVVEQGARDNTKMMSKEQQGVKMKTGKTESKQGKRMTNQ